MRRTETRSCEVTGLVVLLGSPRLTIGQLAKIAGVNVQTVRYYERRDLLQSADRKPSGYRVYDKVKASGVRVGLGSLLVSLVKS